MRVGAAGALYLLRLWLGLMSALRYAHPGHETRLVPDKDPYHGLTQRQRQIFDVVRGYSGNRSRAARQLGVTAGRVQHVLRACEKAGMTVPRGATRGPDSVARPLEPRCRLRMPLSDRCGRRDGHNGSCVSVGAWQRARVA